jgi:hypothetical protein
MLVLDAFNAEFEGRSPTLLGASKSIYKCDASNIWNLAQLHSTERKDRVSGFLAKHMFRWLQVSPPPRHASDYLANMTGRRQLHHIMRSSTVYRISTTNG